LGGLAPDRLVHVPALDHQASVVLPGEVRLLVRIRGRLGNKYHASKFYLLAIVLPWICEHHKKADCP
jgi:hypothetical protein